MVTPGCLIVLISCLEALQAGSPAGGEVAAEVTAAAPAMCEPSCRAGYYCKEGRCETLCNPPCGPAEQCTQAQMCVPRGTYAAAPPAVDRRAQRDEVRRQRAERAEARMSHRETPRLTLTGNAGLVALQGYRVIGDEYEYATMAGLGLTAGYRKNFVRHVGMQLELATLFGSALAGRDDHGDGDIRTHDSTFAADVSVGGMLFFNTWRLYMGPTVSVGRRMFGKDTLVTDFHAYRLSDSATHGTLGGRIGILLLAREQLDIACQLGLDIPHGVPQMFVSLGYHFLLSSGETAPMGRL